MYITITITAMTQARPGAHRNKIKTSQIYCKRHKDQHHLVPNSEASEATYMSAEKFKKTTTKQQQPKPNTPSSHQADQNLSLKQGAVAEGSSESAANATKMRTP